MAKTGLRYFVAAQLDETGATPTYTNGMIVAKAISASIKAEKSDAVKLYADDMIAEFLPAQTTGGTISIEADDISNDAQSLLLGHATSNEEILYNTGDVSPFVGFGYCGETIFGGETKVRAIWIFKASFSEPDDEMKTKSDKTEFSTTSLEAEFMPLSNGDYRTKQTFADYPSALAWLKTQANITT